MSTSPVAARRKRSASSSGLSSDWKRSSMMAWTLGSLERRAAPSASRTMTASTGCENCGWASPLRSRIALQRQVAQSEPSVRRDPREERDHRRPQDRATGEVDQREAVEDRVRHRRFGEAAFAPSPQATDTWGPLFRLPDRRGRRSVGRTEPAVTPGRLPPHHREAPMTPGRLPLHHREAPMTPGRLPLHHREARMTPGRLPLLHREARMTPGRLPLHHREARMTPGRLPPHHREARMTPGRLPLHHREARMTPGRLPLHHREADATPGRLTSTPGRLTSTLCRFKLVVFEADETSNLLPLIRRK